MKGIKRVLSIVLTVALLMTSLAVTVSASAFPDVADNADYANAVSVLSKLGIIKGYEDGSFGPEKEVTRAEFTTMLTRVMGLANDDQNAVWSDTPFTDLSEASWAVGNIRTAYGMGIINGYEDATFRPNANVKYEEAIKMVVCALGYGANISMDGPSWYSNYYAQAVSLGILNNVKGTLETNASRSCIAQLIFGSLEVQIIENNTLSGKTFLSYLGLIKNTGKIAANNNTSLDSPDVNLAENQIEIYAKEPGTSNYESNIYTTDDTSIKNLLGYQVTYYYKYNRTTNERTLILAETKAPKELSIDANLLDPDTSTSSSIRYYQSAEAEKTVSVSVAADNIVIYNGKLYGANAETSRFTADMLPKIGSVKLVDSGSSGSYDTIFIESYVPYYVSSISSSSKTITDSLTRISTASNRQIVLDADDSSYELSIVDTAGKALSFGSISQGDVVNYKESNNNGGTILKTAVVSKEKASGQVTSVQNDSIVVGGKSYEYSPYAPWVVYDSSNSPLSEPSVSDNATFALDINGNILAYDKAATNANTYYGYIMGAESVNADGSNTVGLYILSASGKKAELYTHTSVKVDGKSYKSNSQYEDILSALASSATLQNKDSGSTNDEYTQVIKYTTRTDGKINSIVTAKGVDKGESATTDSLTLYNPVNGVSMTSNSSRQLSGNGKTISTGSAVVFNVPSNRADYDKYSKSTNSTFKNGNSYTIDAFDITTSNSAAVIVVYGQDSTEAVDAETGVYMIEEISSEPVNDETRTVAKGALFKSGSSGSSSKFTETISTGSESLVNGLDEGDIVRFGTDSDGYKSLDSKDILWTPGQNAYIERDDSSKSMLESDPYSAEFVAIHGSVLYAESSDDVIVVTSELIDGSYSGAEEVTISKNDFSSAEIYTYELDSRGKVTLIENQKDGELTSYMTPYNDGDEPNPSKVFIYMSKGRVKFIAIFNEK